MGFDIKLEAGEGTGGKVFSFLMPTEGPGHPKIPGELPRGKHKVKHPEGQMLPLCTTTPPPL